MIAFPSASERRFPALEEECLLTDSCATAVPHPCRGGDRGGVGDIKEEDKWR